MAKKYAVFLPMLDADKSAEYRPAHLEYLEQRWSEGVLSAYGRFADGSGGLLIYTAESDEQVKAWAEADPYVVHKARSYEIHEWALIKANLNNE